ncbi:MAG: hypothetical protein A2X94_13425 [Bdellovibrionales bacterium GWB1_55_8]|nr:MAG: hypothetical protein A2X94_13425 [Bdellovibrionales bacterium GWB1_55_8]
MILGLLASMALPDPALALENVTLVPVRSEDARALARLLPELRDQAVIKTTPVFSENERKALRELNEDALAASLHASFATTEELRAFSNSLAARGIAVRVESRELPVRLSSVLSSKPEPLEHEQWGLKNRGTPLTVPIDDITSTTLTSRAGEDVQIGQVPAEKTGASKIVVAVLDTGVDGAHPDLIPNLLQKPDECVALESYRECLKGTDRKACDERFGNFDSDGNGYPMDCLGWNLTVGKNPLNGIQGNSQSNDTVGHGTHVAGVIGAASNGIGIRGVSQNVALLPVKIFNGNPRSPVRAQSLESTTSGEPVPLPSENGRKWGTGFADVIARGVLYAIRSGAHVMNISLAWPASADSELMRRMVRLAQSRGILIVAAAGNDSTEAEVMPCAYDGVVCVASHQPDGTLSHFSNHGASVDLAAPGVRILSTWPLALRPQVFTDLVGYEFKNGTSMAAPFVTGALARLMAGGMSSDEALARVLIGTRPITGKGSRSVRFGNLDLGGSFRTSPEPLIVPERKGMTEITWERAQKQLTPVLNLKNLWQTAPAAQLTIRLPAELQSALRIDQSVFDFKNWSSGESRTVAVPITILDDEFPSEIDLWVEVKTPRQSLFAAGRPPRSFKVRVSVSVNVGIDSADPEFESIPLVGIDHPRTAVKIRSVLPTGTSASSKVLRDYALIQPNAKGDRIIQLFSRRVSADQEIGSYEFQGSHSLARTDGELLALYRLDLERDGNDEYALLTTFTGAGADGKPSSRFRFVFLDARGTRLTGPTGELTYEPTKAVLPESFSWLANGSRLSPAWVGGGFTPDSEIPAYDPWNPDWSDSPRSRFYYLDASGLRTVKEPKDYTFVATLGQTDSQKLAGVIPVILARGESYRLEYATALVQMPEGAQQPVVAAITPLRLQDYRMLLGFDTAQTAWSLDTGASAAGTAFSLVSRPGTLRTTILQYANVRSAVENVIEKISDVISTPVFETDSVVRTAAVFVGTGGGIFTQTQFDLQFQDAAEGATAVSSLRRFSFLPQLSFLRSFLPAAVHGRKPEDRRLPAILIEGSPTGKDISEVIVPKYGPDGRLEQLIQPARLRLAAAAGCQRIPNPIAPSSGAPTQVSFFCGDRFIRVPLTH